MRKALLKLSFLSVLLVACQSLAQSSIKIVADADVPLDAAVTVDVVFVFDEAVVTQLPFEQFAWMSSRNEVQARFGEKLSVVTSEVIPGTTIDLSLPNNANNAASILVFSSHEDPVAEGLDISFEIADGAKITLRVEDWGIDVIAE